MQRTTKHLWRGGVKFSASAFFKWPQIFLAAAKIVIAKKNEKKLKFFSCYGIRNPRQKNEVKPDQLEAFS